MSYIDLLKSAVSVWFKKIFLFTHRNHKLNKQAQETQKQYAYLSVTYIQNDNSYWSVTYIQNDNHTDICDGKMANYCQNVRGNKTNKRPKWQQKTNKQTKQKQQQQQNGLRGRISLNTAHIICSAVGCNLQLYHVKPKVIYLHGMGFCYRRITKSRR